MSTPNPSPTEITFKFADDAKNTSRKFLQFYEEQKFFDTTLIAGSDGVKIQAHKMVLGAFSDHFLELFRSSQTASKVEVVELEEIEASTIKMIIDFMYSGTIELETETVEGLLRVAAFLKIETIIAGCCEFIEKLFSTSNCLNWMRIAKELKLSGLEEKALNYSYSNFEKVSKEKEFFLLKEMELKDLLFNDNPHGDFEEEIFLSIVAWVEYDEDNRKPILLELLKMVRYQFLTPKFIMREVYGRICDTDLICRWMKWHVLPETRPIGQNKRAFTPRVVDQLVSIFTCSYNVEFRVYNPDMNSWRVQIRTPIPCCSINCSIIVIEDMLVLVGGTLYGNVTNRVQCFNWKTLVWTELPSMKRPRRDSQLANLNGILCVFGGYGRDGKEIISPLEIYNFSTCEWKYVEPLYGLTRCSRIVGHNGILYVVDFYYGLFQCYDVSSNKWTSKELKVQDIQTFYLVAVDTSLYAFFLKDRINVKCYNLTSETWSTKATSKSEDIGDITNLSVIKNKIILFGKETVYRNRITQEFSYNAEYDFVTDSWEYDKQIYALCNGEYLCTLPI